MGANNLLELEDWAEFGSVAKSSVGIGLEEFAEVVVQSLEQIRVMLDTFGGSIKPHWRLGWDRDGGIRDLEECLVKPVWGNEGIIGARKHAREEGINIIRKVLTQYRFVISGPSFYPLEVSSIGDPLWFRFFGLCWVRLWLGIGALRVVG
jgi:hypothetical protein